MRKDFNMMVSGILKILKYDASVENDPYPMSWPRPSGIGHALAISVKVSPTFWRWFSTTGKLRLNEYNQVQGTKVMDYNDWNGTAIEELSDERLKKENESGRMAIGLLVFPGLESDKENQRTQSYSEVTARGIKRSAQEDQHLLPKRNAKE
ncbi:hypothetical protein Y032_0912g3009 [Ancylostoma ceylanicum]|uniref:Uncharacterized protein n=2 Tax=Ancylostoma ceylanicum TaxID=53326 RepID=A0A016WAI1_9BILA|nr:hypothetical protein Y032_0912g3009 [Ancylostoma ceylanicum]